MRFVEPLTAIYQNGPYLYVQDSAGDQTLIYGNQQATFTNGDLIVDAVACWSNENLTPPHMYYPFYAQLAAPVGEWTVGGHGEPVKPTPVTIGDVGADLLHHYIELKGVYRYSSNELRDMETGARLTLHNMFDLTYPGDMSRVYDVVCFGAFYYSTSWNVFPLEFKPHVPRGDVDGDYEVGLSDVNCIISALLANGEPEASLMDVNLDGEVNIGDVNNLIDIILTEGD